jgi:hypothetical protein
MFFKEYHKRPWWGLRCRYGLVKTEADLGRIFTLGWSVVYFGLLCSEC